MHGKLGHVEMPRHLVSIKLNAEEGLGHWFLTWGRWITWDSWEGFWWSTDQQMDWLS